MQKIRFADETELEIHNISNNGNTLTVDVLNGDSTAVEELMSAPERLAVIQYYAETDLLRAYAGYTVLDSYTKKMNQTISTDWTQTDPKTQSGFVEEKADILSVILIKPEMIDKIAGQVAQNTANIDYLSMETGIEL